MKLKVCKEVLVERQLLSPISYNLGHLGYILEMSRISFEAEHLNASMG